MGRNAECLGETVHVRKIFLGKTWNRLRRMRRRRWEDNIKMDIRTDEM
jgi:hypothetical protein